MPEPSLDELAAEVAEMRRRLEELEARLAALRAREALEARLAVAASKRPGY
jgi:phage shock protein A